MSTVADRLQQWQQELLDFSNRNRLLNFRPSTSRPSSVELVAPDAATIYEALLQGRSLTVVGQEPEAEDDEGGPDLTDDGLLDTIETRESFDDPEQRVVRPGTALSSLPTDRASRVLLRLLTRARASEQEQGINTLFAVFGLLKWQEKSGSDAWQYAPLVMLPLAIEERTREGSFRIASTGDDPEFNQTVAERLRRDFGLDIAVELDEETHLSTALQGSERQSPKGRDGRFCRRSILVTSSSTS